MVIYHGKEYQRSMLLCVFYVCVHIYIITGIVMDEGEIHLPSLSPPPAHSFERQFLIELKAQHFYYTMWLARPLNLPVCTS